MPYMRITCDGQVTDVPSEIFMKTQLCRDCKHEVSRRAKTCPNCGRPRPALGPKQFFFGALVLLLLIAYFWSTPGDAPSESSVSSPPSPTASSVSPSSRGSEAITVSAKQLWSAYQQNEVSADARYRDRLLLVGGQVESINKDALDKVYLVLAAPGLLGVHATLKDSQLGAAAGVSRGDHVSLLCTGAGLIIGAPMLDDCEFWSK
jgi:tRNA_anti-like